jgi:hypothetical protein
MVSMNSFDEPHKWDDSSRKYKGIGILLAVDIFLKFFTVRKDIDANSEDEVKVKEQAVLELGQILAETRQAEGCYFYYMNCFQYFWYNNNVNNIYTCI